MGGSKGEGREGGRERGGRGKRERGGRGEGEEWEGKWEGRRSKFLSIAAHSN